MQAENNLNRRSAQINLAQYPTDCLLTRVLPGVKQPTAKKGEQVIYTPVKEFVLGFGENCGLGLAGKFICVDIDRPADPVAAEYSARLPVTYTVKTPRGWHYLFRVPSGWTGAKKKIACGEILTSGYIVGPGSWIEPTEGHPGGEYRLVNFCDPVPAPDWLLDLARRDPEPSLDVTRTGTERDRILDGERDDALTALAGSMRRQGYSEDAMRAMLSAIVESGVVEQPPGREVTERDVARIARSMAQHQTGGSTVPEIALLPDKWTTGADVSRDFEKLEWVLPGFIPAVGLTVLYGDGKIGKSSWASWLASAVSRTGKKVIMVPSGEETFKQFVQRARLTDCEDSLFVCWPGEARFVLPKSVRELNHAIELLKDVGLIYIDALYSHFGDTPGLHAGERARYNLQALAQLALDRRIAVLGTIHENASGGLLGSREMRNVARSLIHAKRKPGGDFTIWSDGSNGFSSDFGVSFPGVAVPVLDSNNRPVVFTDLFGQNHPQAVWVLRLGEKIGAPDTITVDDISKTPVELIREYLILNPGASNAQIADALSMGKSTVDRHAREARSTLAN